MLLPIVLLSGLASAQIKMKPVGATMSSEYNYGDGGYEVQNCFDGNGDTMCHTTGETNPWVQYDMGVSIDVDYVEIANRRGPCSSRLACSDSESCRKMDFECDVGYEIRVGDTACAHMDQSEDCDQDPVCFSSGPIASYFVVNFVSECKAKGRYVTFRQPGPNRIINLMEMTVYAVTPSPTLEPTIEKEVVACDSYTEYKWKCPKKSKSDDGLTCFWDDKTGVCTEEKPVYECDEFIGKKKCRKLGKPMWPEGGCKWNKHLKTCIVPGTPTPCTAIKVKNACVKSKCYWDKGTMACYDEAPKERACGEITDQKTCRDSGCVWQEIAPAACYEDYSCGQWRGIRKCIKDGCTWNNVRFLAGLEACVNW